MRGLDQPLRLPHILELLHSRLLRFLAHVWVVEGAAHPSVSTRSTPTWIVEWMEVDLRTKPSNNMAIVFLLRFSAGSLGLVHSSQLLLGVLLGGFADVVIGESPKWCLLVDNDQEM